MSRISNADTLAQANAARHSMAHLAVIEFDGMTVRVCDSFRTITWGGYDYLACGDMVGFESVSETSDLRINSVTAGMSGVDQAYLAELYSLNYLDRPIRIYRAYLDDGGAIIGEPLLLFEGRINEPTVQDDPETGKFIVAIKADSIWTDFEQTNGLKTNDSTHQRIFPGDKGFEFAAQILDQIKWGRA